MNAPRTRTPGLDGHRSTQRTTLPGARHALLGGLILCILASAGGCAEAPTPEGAGPEIPSAEAPAPEPDGVADEAAERPALPGRVVFVDSALAVRPESRAELQALLGAPDSTQMEVVPNRHVPGVLDTLYTVHYSDLVARFHHPGGGGDLLSMVEVTHDRHLRYPVLGRSVTDVDAAFGRPDEASDSSLTYYCTTCEAGHDPVELIFHELAVRSVRFSFYVD